MKKLILISLIFGCALLSACAGFTPPTQNKNTLINKPLPQKSRLTRPSSKSASRYGTSSVTLNDFTDLSLNNYEPTQGNLWEEIGKGLKIPNQENRPEVQAQIRWFMSHPGYLQRTTERARPYLYIVYQEVKSRNLVLSFFFVLERRGWDLAIDAGNRKRLRTQT